MQDHCWGGGCGVVGGVGGGVVLGGVAGGGGGGGCGGAGVVVRGGGVSCVLFGLSPFPFPATTTFHSRH